MFRTCCNIITSNNKSCLISGGFNFNLLDVDHNHSQEFLFAYSCVPLINKPTRITRTSATLIDNIFTNISPLPNFGILIHYISDHFPVFAFSNILNMCSLLISAVTVNCLGIS